MKPFNLEEAKAGKPVCTRDGKDVRIICFDRQAPSPIVGLVYAEGLGEFCRIFYANGEAEDADKSNDLFMKPEKHKGYVNIYRNELGCNYPLYQVMDSFTKEQAQDRGKMRQDYITTVEIEWEE